jgi:lipid A 3-O-deacylase
MTPCIINRWELMSEVYQKINLVCAKLSRQRGLAKIAVVNRCSHLFIFMLMNLFGHAQDHLLRAYMDNDFFAFQKEDGAYTNGLRLDYFYTPKRTQSAPAIYFVAGKGSTLTSGIGIMQIMITPNQIRDVHPPAGDYPYSGSLFGILSANSINKNKTKSITTEYVAGLIGPWSLAGQTQIGFHRMAGFVRPTGWDTQYPTTLFLNVNISTEQLITSVGGCLEWVAGAELQVGTMVNSVKLSSILRVGKMNPYFNGMIKRYSAREGKHFQLYFSLKPYFEFVAHNALLEGTVLNSQTSGFYETSDSKYGLSGEKRLVSPEIYGGEAELVTIYRSFGFSVGYKGSSGVLRHQPFKGYGNISLYCAL